MGGRIMIVAFDFDTELLEQLYLDARAYLDKEEK